MPKSSQATQITEEELQNAVAEILDTDSFQSARNLIHTLQPAETADLLESLPQFKRKQLWSYINEDEGEVLLEVGDEVRASLARYDAAVSRQTGIGIVLSERHCRWFDGSRCHHSALRYHA